MKIFIYGPSGVGKSTLAKKLANHFHIRYYDLDIVLQNISELSERTKRIEFIFCNHLDSFVVEGLYKQDRLDNILLQCDYIILMHEPLRIRNIKIIWRHMQRKFHIKKTHFSYTLQDLIKLLRFSAMYESHDRKQEFLDRIKRLYKEGVLLVQNDYNNIIDTFSHS